MKRGYGYGLFGKRCVVEMIMVLILSSFYSSSSSYIEASIGSDRRLLVVVVVIIRRGFDSRFKKSLVVKVVKHAP